MYKNNNNFQGKYEKYKKLLFRKKKLNEARRHRNQKSKLGAIE